MHHRGPRNLFLLESIFSPTLIGMLYVVTYAPGPTYICFAAIFCADTDAALKFLPGHVSSILGLISFRVLYGLNPSSFLRASMLDIQLQSTHPFSHLYSANTLQTAANALATLSLSSSPPTPAQTHHSTSFTGGASAIPIPSRTTRDSNSKSAPLDDGSNFPTSSPNHEHDSGLTKGGKKRGTIFTCESCSKVGLTFVTCVHDVELIITCL